MSAGVADILCITQITFIIVPNALLANYGWFWLTHLEVFTYFATLEHRLKSVIVLLRSDNCFFTVSDDFSSLKPLGEQYFCWWPELALQGFQTTLR